MPCYPPPRRGRRPSDTVVSTSTGDLCCKLRLEEWTLAPLFRWIDPWLHIFCFIVVQKREWSLFCCLVGLEFFVSIFFMSECRPMHMFICLNCMHHIKMYSGPTSWKIIWKLRILSRKFSDNQFSKYGEFLHYECMSFFFALALNIENLFLIITGLPLVSSNLQMISQYSGEDEYLMPPLCCLEVRIFYMILIVQVLGLRIYHVLVIFVIIMHQILWS